MTSPLAILEEAVDDARARYRWSCQIDVFSANYFRINEGCMVFPHSRTGMDAATTSAVMNGLWTLWRNRKRYVKHPEARTVAVLVKPLYRIVMTAAHGSTSQHRTFWLRCYYGNGAGGIKQTEREVWWCWRSKNARARVKR
jgi:hypothetical protein